MSLQTSSVLPRQNLTFSAASLTVLIAFGASALPVPLMSTWTREFGLSTAAIGMTVLLYVVGNACSLLFFARLSEVIGRRGAVFISLLFGLSACACFLAADSPAFLMAGRLLQGLAFGITTTAAMSWCVDSAPPERSWLATAVSSSGPLAGFVIATIGAGVAIEMQLASTRGLFFSVLVLELLVSVLVFLASETVTTKNSKKGILKPSVMPPPGYGRRLALAATGLSAPLRSHASFRDSLQELPKGSGAPTPRSRSSRASSTSHWCSPMRSAPLPPLNSRRLRSLRRWGFSTSSPGADRFSP